MDMIYVKGGRRNLVSVGWENGVLQLEFKGGRRYRYAAPAEIRDKLLRVPYPDHLWTQLQRKNRFEQVGKPPANSGSTANV